MPKRKENFSHYYNGIHCPKCGGKVDTVSERIEPTNARTAYQDVACSKCGTVYTECYKIIVLEEQNPEPDLAGTIVAVYPVKD